MKKDASKENIAKTVLVFGTFDGVHPGHIFFLSEAKKLGGENAKLIVSIASQEVVKEKKKKIPKSESERIAEIKSLKIADKVLVGEKKTESWKILKKICPDIIAAGYDQKKLVVALKRDKEIIGFPFEIKIIKSFKPKIYHTSILKKIKD